ncbi:putative NAD(P)-binding domain superfamily [Helianthus annuus]|nr:putative NAD(P)-binding domain superfamily [Helianthus annuus]KAJ0566725.1 putative NAD(P)-binding domain superfamily [Helianthus annuus]
MEDLATAFIKVLGNEKEGKQVYNILGDRYVTFDGLARACAKAGGFPEPEIIHYNPKEFHYGKKKAFPFQNQICNDKDQANSWFRGLKLYFTRFVVLKLRNFGLSCSHSLINFGLIEFLNYNLFNQVILSL